MFHRDPDVRSALIRLIDALCTWERNTGNGSKLFLVHDNEADGETIFAMDGKPLEHTPFELGLALDLIKNQIMPQEKKKDA